MTDSRSMTAIEVSQPGKPEVLVPACRPVPEPAPGEIRIAVQAAGVNRPDVLQRLGKYNPPPGITIRPAQPGSAPQPASTPAAKPGKPATTPAEKPVADPIAEIARQDAAKTGYFLQVGAYKSAVDADRQKGNLAMQGFEAKVTQREVNGATMYRVRLGPYNTLDEMTAVRSRLQASGVESSVIRFARH